MGVCGFDKNDLAVVTKDGSKIYLFFDSVHLMKNIRNNLLNNKMFLFPAFSFSGFYDQINCDVERFRGSCFMMFTRRMRSFKAI